jgi:N-acetylmuramic acid 6-phosphate etherase
MLIQILDLDPPLAGALLSAAGGEVKTALVMHRAGVGADVARRRLDEADGVVGRVVSLPGALR